MDDVARAVVPIGGRPRVLLVTAGNYFLENALNADPEIAFELLSPEVWRNGMASSFDAVVFDDFLPEGLTKANAADGNFLFIGQNPWSMGTDERIANPVITNVETGSPLVTGLSLDGITINSAQAVDGLLPVVESVDDALIAVGDSGTARTAVFGFRVQDSNLPLRIAFPLLVANTVHWLTGIEEPLTARAGEIVRGADSELIGEFDVAGFYPVEDGRTVAINPAGGDESDLRGAATDGSALASTIRSGIPLWKWLVGLALGLLAFERWAWSRRWIR